MKNRNLFTVVLSLAAIMLFFLMLNSGRETLMLRKEAVMASAVVRETAYEDTVTAVDDELLDPETPLKLKYNRYPLTYVYFVVMQESIPVYSSPNADKRVVREAEYREKLNYLETVTLQGNAPQSQTSPVAVALNSQAEGEVQASAPVEREIWYHVFWYENEKGEVTADGSEEGAEKQFGFIPEGSAEKRRLRIDEMLEYVKKADDFTSEGEITYIVNYKNAHGKPPLYRGEETDAQGNRRSQSAPGYPDLADLQEFTYLADGTLVRVLAPLVSEGAGEKGTEGGYRRVLCLADGKEYYVPLKYIPIPEAMSPITKAVVIDRANQNEGVFEKIDGVWTCISCTLATTGTKSQYAAPTPLGYFAAMQKRPQFYYYKDGTTQVQGYAPYVLRFCGGAYIHGVPVSYEYVNGKRVTPPLKEFSSTLGTEPLSHKCVRNYTSHAEFLYEWYEEGRTAVIVME